MSVLKPISPFRKWVYHTLPLVYDDSLSYMELLSKVIKYCNELRDSDDHLSEELQKAIASIKDLQEYVDERFDEKMGEAIDKYFAEHDLVQSVNGQSGEVNIESLKNPNKIIIAVYDPTIHSEGETTNYEYDGETEVTVPIELPAIPAPPVTSVNGQTGAVQINSLPNQYALVISYGGVQQAVYNGSEGKHVNIPAPVYPVTSVNGKTGAVVVSLSELNGLANVVNSVNGNVLIVKSVDINKLKGAVSDSGKVLSIAGDGSIQAVTIGAASETVLSVNGMLGAVVLTAENVGAIPDENGAVKLTHLANAGTDNIGKGLIVGEDGNLRYGNIGAVTSVNGKTGAVQIDAGDVGALSNQAGSVGSNNIAENAVGTYQIADGSITREKMAFSVGGATFYTWEIGRVDIPKNDLTWKTLTVLNNANGGCYAFQISITDHVTGGTRESMQYMVRVRKASGNEDMDLIGTHVLCAVSDTNSAVILANVPRGDTVYIEAKALMSTSGLYGRYLTGLVKAIYHE